MRIVFMGTPDFAVPSLAALCDAGYEVVGVFTQPDKPKGRGKKLAAPPVKEEALRRGIPVFQLSGFPYDEDGFPSVLHRYPFPFISSSDDER